MLQSPQPYGIRNVESINRSLAATKNAALNLSRVPIDWLRQEASTPFIITHLITAAVILSIEPTSNPFTDSAHECKKGILRMIQASKTYKPSYSAAELAYGLLTDLLKVTLRREMENALPENSVGVHDEEPSSVAIQSNQNEQATRALRHYPPNQVQEVASGQPQPEPGNIRTWTDPQTISIHESQQPLLGEIADTDASFGDMLAGNHIGDEFLWTLDTFENGMFTVLV